MLHVPLVARQKARLESRHRILVREGLRNGEERIVGVAFLKTPAIWAFRIQHLLVYLGFFVNEIKTMRQCL